MTPLHPDVIKALDAKRPWIIMPVLAQRDYTIAAIADCLQQSRSHTLLIVNQGVDNAFRDELERLAEAHAGVLVWSHVPPLPSLSATWNRALDAAWAAGASEALVVNNDVRLGPHTLHALSTVLRRCDALLVSAVGVTPEQFASSGPPDIEALTRADERGDGHPVAPGGPDFSCFLITRACHAAYRFDESFVPAFCEDLDYHRRLLLGGDGARIFSVNLPYLHYASATLKSLPPEQANRIRTQIEQQSRAYYARKWGGPVNQERLIAPFGQDGTSGWNDDTATTPRLQARVAAGLPPIGCGMHTDQPFDACAICAREQEEYDRTSREQEPDEPRAGWTDADRARALQQPEDLDE